MVNAVPIIIPLVFAAFLGMLPVAAYYFGWLAGRPANARAQRWVFRVYVFVFAALLCVILLAALAALIGDDADFWESDAFMWTFAGPIGLLLILSPTLAIWFFFGSFVQRQGECNRCGYSLQGNQSGRCPECGSVTDGAQP